MKLVSALLAALVVAAAGPLMTRAESAAAPRAVSCESLISFKRPNTTVTAAQLVGAGQFVAPGARGGGQPMATLPAFCRVTATLTPSPDSDIKVEVWMPASGWNGRF